MSGKIESRLFINGEFRDASDGGKFKLVNPATKKLTCEVAEATTEDVNSAVAAAKAAFPAWSAKSAGERAEILMKFGDLIRDHTDELAELESASMGIVKNNIPMLTTMAYHRCHQFAQLGWQAQGKTSLNNPGLFSFTLRQPYGVVGAIIPWNAPILLFTWKVAAAVAAGNTVVLKSSEKAPLTSCKFAELSVKAGFPPGVLNVISGHGMPSGDALSSHMDVRAISFTGSGRTGKLVQANAAKSNLKHVVLELGGKSPSLVFDDCDLEQAVSDLRTSITWLSGQVCIASSRVYVQDTIADAFVQKFKELFAQSVAGDPNDPEAVRGPQADEIQYNNVKNYIEDGKSAGGKMILGDEPADDKGYNISPTIFTGTPEDAKIMKEEIFGPVVNINTFKTEEEALEKANASEYGLYASVYTKDATRAIRVARGFESGDVGINCTSPTMTLDLPFGGYKQSGQSREGLVESLDHFLETKTVMMKI